MFLYPELSKQVDLLSMLMRSLSRHLQPAPYPYGLLTLRLLGKLGGKNRQFLRDHTFLPLVTGKDEVKYYRNDLFVPWLQVTDCSWKVASDTDESGMESFSLPIPLNHAVRMLKTLALTEPLLNGASAPNSNPDNSDQQSENVTPKQAIPGKKAIEWGSQGGKDLWDCADFDKIDFDAYSKKVMVDTKASQASAALTVVESAMKCYLRRGDRSTSKVEGVTEGDASHDSQQVRKEPLDNLLRNSAGAEEANVVAGLLYAATLREEEAKDNEPSEEKAFDLLCTFLPELKPSPAAEALVDTLKEIPDSKSLPVFAVTKKLIEKLFNSASWSLAEAPSDFCSCLVQSLCGACHREVVMCILVHILVYSRTALPEWKSHHHEMELFIAAFVSVKTAPREIASTSARATEFFFQICTCLYGQGTRCWTDHSIVDNHDASSATQTLIWDPLYSSKQARDSHPREQKENMNEKTPTNIRTTEDRASSIRITPMEEVVKISLHELVYPQHLVR